MAQTKILPTLNLEMNLWQKGYHRICGMDEVGRGAFAGPVVAGAVVFPKDVVLPVGLADSKLLKPKERERLSEEIRKAALDWAIAEISVRDINKVGIGKATQMAFRRALRQCSVQADYVLIDAFYVKHFNRKRQKPIKGGDKVCASISAASIIAKVHRDKLMKKLHQKYPQYGFAKHKGYGTLEHREALKKYGLSRVHRKSFNLDRFLH